MNKNIENTFLNPAMQSLTCGDSRLLVAYYVCSGQLTMTAAVRKVFKLVEAGDAFGIPLRHHEAFRLAVDYFVAEPTKPYIDVPVSCETIGDEND